MRRRLSGFWLWGLGISCLGCGDDAKEPGGPPAERLVAELTESLRSCELLSSEGKLASALAFRPETWPKAYGECVDACYAELASDCDELAEWACDDVVSERQSDCVSACNRVENRCDAGKKVYFFTQVCDDFPDCEDRSDERHCMELTGNCDDGQRLFSSNQICDGNEDCSDGSDEAECPFLNVCDEGLKSVEWNQRCNGEPDCEDGTDEKGCDALEPSFFQCEAGGVVPRAYVCDLAVDCPDGSDESSAQGCAALLCPGLPFQCRDGGTVPIEKICDGAADCEDESDELNCGSTSVELDF